jgi:predicted dehydrogenase
MKLAIVGNGKIVNECLFALQDIPEIEVVSIWGRPTSLNKTKMLADDYGIMEVYTDYEKMLMETNADTV